MRRIAVTTTASLILSAAIASAQTAAPFDAILHLGEAIVITTRSGQLERGVVLSVSPASVTIKSGRKTNALSMSDVQRIERSYRDPVTDGLKHGALAGLVIGATLGVIGASSDCGNRDTFLNFCSPEGFLVVGGLLGGYGAGIGAAIGVTSDALIQSRRLIWPVSIATRGGVSLRFTIHW